MSEAETRKVCPLMLLAGAAIQMAAREDWDHGFCIEDKCAWWTEQGPVRLDGSRAVARCGIAR